MKKKELYRFDTSDIDSASIAYGLVGSDGDDDGDEIVFVGTYRIAFRNGARCNRHHNRGVFVDPQYSSFLTLTINSSSDLT